MTTRADLAARIRATPDDDALKSVFADLLQLEGDPWGELIARELAGDDSDHFMARLALTGSFAPIIFGWDKGFISSISLPHEGTRERQPAILDELLAMPAAMIVRELALHLRLDAAFVAQINARIPPTVTTFRTSLTTDAGGLVLPNVVRLDLSTPHRETLDTAAIAPLFGDQLPRLKRLEIWNGPLELDLVAALLDSPLVQRLDWLVLAQGALDRAGVELVTARRADLAHLRGVRLDGAEAAFKELSGTFNAWLADFANR